VGSGHFIEGSGTVIDLDAIVFFKSSKKLSKENSRRRKPKVFWRFAGVAPTAGSHQRLFH
jgi:hypothetical protein